MEPSDSNSGLKIIQLNDQKAGMEGLNKEIINKIIYEASKGTPYFVFQEKRQKSIDSKINELVLEMQKLTDVKRKESLKMMDALCASLENKRNLSHSIVHIDMDAFYAAVEMHDNPDLKDKPMAVGSSSMLSTSNYHARKYGVRAAMPGFIAKKLCPELVIVPCNFEKYRKVSKNIRNIVEEYDPDFCCASLDEVYLDLTEYIKNQHKKKLHEEYCLKNDLCDSFMDDTSHDENCVIDYADCLSCSEPLSIEAKDKMASFIVEEIRERIFKTTELTASAGIAPNTMLAKVCSDQNKPNGQFQIPSTVEAVKSFIATLPVKKVSGIGPVQGQILNAIGIHTCSDMWTQRDLVACLFSPNSVEFYMRVALGIGSTTVKSDYVRKSIGNEQTFKEISQYEDLLSKCKELTEDLVEDMKSHHVLGKVVVLKIKNTNFATHTRNHSLSHCTADHEIIYKAAKKLLDNEIAAIAPQPLRLRLMGLRMCNLVAENAISSNEKQQTTLKNFLQLKAASGTTKSPSKSKETLTCPVCLEEFQENFLIFNDHVNNCVTNQSFDEIECDVSGTTQDGHFEKSEMCLNKSPVLSDSSLSYICPVCELNPNVSDLAQLNTHIDNCLNKATIKEILANESKNVVKRKLFDSTQNNSKRVKVSKKEKKIDEYFR